MNIGFIGLGNMGGGMAANVLRAGHDLTVHDLRREAATPLLENGASWADTPAEVAAASEVVLTSLPGPREVEAIALGDSGVLEGSTSGKVYIDLSTSSPTLIRSIAEDFAAKGVSVLDAPVSGGPVGARTGRLAVMVGGDREVYERVKPALDAIGDKVSYIGPVGSGSIAKLMHNCIGYGLQTIVAECLTLGVKAGVDPEPLFEAISNGSVGRGSSFANTYPNTFLAGNFDPPSFALRLAHKDVSLALELAREYGVPMSVGNIAHQELTSALNRGWADLDSRVAMKLQEERAGNVEVRIEKADADALEA
ncbi:MAG: NAD(P)-dependent oxidoreductase [Chloroflexi bacterium]|nr:NAD(P)-dependent oxidoreductase [Chloroflexota bacterium]